ncbi:MAG: Hpt domain-containing protein [Candidatus Gastranaerophilales bacterium]|nr:Hpt domain-containing protein [Candidatus Gastranaerophilales bacterium]
MDNNLEAKLKEFKKAYLAKLDNSVSSLIALINHPGKINIETLYDEVHKISGTSGVYGFRELSALATDFEFYLKKLKTVNSNADEAELKNMFIQFIKKIQQIIKEGV